MKECIMNPTEIWGSWADEKTQLITNLIFLKVGEKYSYFCNVQSGKIVNFGLAKYVNRFRNGLKFTKL